MSKTADEAWADYEALFIDNDMGDVPREMRLQREATETTAREIAREVCTEGYVARLDQLEDRLLGGLAGRIAKVEGRVAKLEKMAHYHGGMGVDEDLQAEADNACLDCGEDAGSGVLFCRECHEVRKKRIRDLQAEQEWESGVTDLEELAWGVIANSYGGSWQFAPDTWREAAERWRNKYHAKLGVRPESYPDPSTEGGDADDRGRRIPTAGNVAPGAGAESEQDAPAPSEPREPDYWIIDIDGGEYTEGYITRAEAEKERRRMLKELAAENPDGELPQAMVRPVWVGEPPPAPSEDPEGEVEPVARISDGGGLEVLDDVRGIVAGDFLYSHETVQRLQREIAQLRRERKQARRGDHGEAAQVAVLMGDIERLEAQIARLSDPENWGVRGKLTGRLLDNSIYRSEYIGPESEGESDHG